MSGLDSGDFWVGSGGFVWFQVVWGGFGWFRVVSGGLGWVRWFRVVSGFINTESPFRLVCHTLFHITLHFQLMSSTGKNDFLLCHASLGAPNELFWKSCSTVDILLGKLTQFMCCWKDETRLCGELKKTFCKMGIIAGKRRNLFQNFGRSLMIC